MARIKKKGLDYFPLNTDFIHDRAVRRLMKREGDSALGILVEILSYIYAGEGYYVRADRLFYEDLSAGLYEKSADDVERIVRLAVEYGLFDAVLFERSCILTSVEIQRQYLFSTRRRSISHLEVGYCLLADDEPADNKDDMKEQPAFGSEETEGGKSVSVGDNKDDAKGTPAVKSEKQGHGEGITRGDNVTFIPENVTSGTHSTAQHSVAQQSKAKNNPTSILPWKRQGRRRRGRRLGRRRFLPEVPAGGMLPVPGNGKSGRRRLSTAFFRRLTGHHATMRGCSIISVATVSRLQNSMRLSLKVISGLSAVRSGVGLPRCVAVEAR